MSSTTKTVLPQDYDFGLEDNQPITREKIEKVVKSFFQDVTWRPNYFRKLEDLEDPYCTLDEDITFDNVGRADLFEWIEHHLKVECEDDFVWRCKTLDQIYKYLERRCITENRGPPKRPNWRPKPLAKKEDEYAGPKTVMLFPGQGVQKVGMVKELINTNSAARRLFATAKKVLGYDIQQLCLEGPEDKLNTTEFSQPAIFVASLAVMEKFKQENTELVRNCGAAAGLSLGEYTALVFAQAISFEDGLKLVQLRGKAMQKAAEMSSTGMMSILGGDLQFVEDIVKRASSAGKIFICNYLCPGNLVVGGDQAALNEAEKLCKEDKEPGRKIILSKLKVAGAFHTEFMKPAFNELKAALAETKIVVPEFPVISNVDGKPHTNPEEIRELLAKQLTSPVLWENSIHYLLDEKYNRFQEVGVGKVLSGLMRHILKKREGEQPDVQNFSF